MLAHEAHLQHHAANISLFSPQEVTTNFLAWSPPLLGRGRGRGSQTFSHGRGGHGRGGRASNGYPGNSQSASASPLLIHVLFAKRVTESEILPSHVFIGSTKPT